MLLLLLCYCVATIQHRVDNESWRKWSTLAHLTMWFSSFYARPEQLLPRRSCKSMVVVVGADSKETSTPDSKNRTADLTFRLTPSISYGTTHSPLQGIPVSRFSWKGTVDLPLFYTISTLSLMFSSIIPPHTWRLASVTFNADEMHMCVWMTPFLCVQTIPSKKALIIEPSAYTMISAIIHVV